MIIKINGTPINYRKAEQKPVKNEAFYWQTKVKKVTNIQVRPESSPVAVTEFGSDIDVATKPKTETLRDRLTRIREAAKKHLIPLTTGINLLAVAPISSLAGQYSIPVATQVTTAGVKPIIGIAPALQPVISMLQEFALPVGIGMAIWGLIEIIIGNPGGKDKIKYAMLGYIGVFVIPYFFYQIKGALSVMPLAYAALMAVV